MTAEAWLLFCLTETLLCLSPGPAVLLVTSTSLTEGRTAGGLASAGVLSTNLLYFAISATGLGALLLASWQAFALVKWAGAAYLAWLGLRLLFTRQEAPSEDASPRPAHGRALLRGAVVQGANPKTLLYFSAILPQFTSPDAPWAPQMLVLGASSIAIEALVLVVYAEAAHRARRVATPRIHALSRRVGGGLLVAAAAGLASLRRETS